MSRVGVLRRTVAVAGGVVGVAAAGAAAAALAERRLVARRRVTAEVPFGSLHGVPGTVTADDGVELYVETDEPIAERADAPTVVFVHGYALNLACWHFQRAALRGCYRLVLFDQRSHGRSARSESSHCTIDQLGRDLAAVVEQAAGGDGGRRGGVVLVGHSMGSMAVLALAEQRPEWFGDRVRGVALISASAGDLQPGTLGLTGFGGRVLHLLSPAVLSALALAPALTERGRRAGSDLGYALTRRLSFGSRVPQEYVDFTDEMLTATPIGVVADFYPGFDDYDKTAALPLLSEVPTLIVAGDKDVLTPIDHARRIAAKLPSAELLELADAGHMVLLERHAEVDEALLALLRKVEADG